MAKREQARFTSLFNADVLSLYLKNKYIFRHFTGCICSRAPVWYCLHLNIDTSTCVQKAALMWPISGWLEKPL